MPVLYKGNMGEGPAAKDFLEFFKKRCDVRKKHQEKQGLKRPFLVKRLSQFMTTDASVPVAQQKRK